MFGHVFYNLGGSMARGVTSGVSSMFRSSSAYKDGDKLTSHHEAQLLRLSQNLAYSADLALLLGGRLKFEELLLGRMADAMSAIYLGYAVLWHYQHQKGIEGLEAMTEHAMLTLEHEAQEALREAAANFPAPLGSAFGFLMGLGTSPLGEFSRPYRPPSDALTKEVADLLTKPSGRRDLFNTHIYVSGEENDHLSTLLRAFPVVIEADQIQKALRKEQREPTSAEAQTLALATELRDQIVQVTAQPWAALPPSHPNTPTSDAPHVARTPHAHPSRYFAHPTQYFAHCPPPPTAHRPPRNRVTCSGSMACWSSRRGTYDRPSWPPSRGREPSRTSRSRPLPN